VGLKVDRKAPGITLAGAPDLSAKELIEILEQLPSGVVVVDGQGRPLLANQAARRLAQPAIDDVLTHLAPTLRGESVASHEYMLARADTDEPLRVRVSGIPLRDQFGTITGAVAIVTEIAQTETEEALARLEQELAERERTEEALQSSQQRLRLALEASHMGTWDYDVVEDRVEWSPEMAAIVGEPLESLSGSLDAGFKHVHPEDRESVMRAVRDALEHGQGFQVETRIVIRPDNKVRWLMGKGRVYRDEQGRPLRMTGIVMDITGRKDAEAARHSMAHGERLRAMGEMASGIAHDLNQSLALITGYSDMVRQELNLGVPEVSRIREMIDITARAALEGGKALRGLLSFVRTQEMIAEIERLEAGDILHDVARLTAPRWRDATQAEGRPISMEVVSEPACWMNGSPAELREAITNLIFNAVDALPRGGVIDLRASRQREHVVIEVSDTGTGMPKDVQARVFDPFFTTKGEYGSGLGLPQVLAIVERHGGTIELQSTPNRGTTFRMTFPPASPPAARPPQPIEKPISSPKRWIRILVVEDEEQLARMARVVLTQHGHQVVVASSGEEALDILSKEHFELVISDLGLGGGKNGWDLAVEVRDQWPTTRFVLVTGWGAAIDPKEAMARGVDEVIAKPYRIDTLRQVADQVADGQDSR
jgi:PAS domain S-box-containing protein